MNIFHFIYLFLAVLGLHCWSGFSLVAASGGYSLVVACRLLIAVVSPVAEHRLQGMVAWASGVAASGLSSCAFLALEHRLSNCGAQV